MASIQTQPAKLFACNIAAYSDGELDQYLEDNRGLIKVEDPENIMRDQNLLQRLRTRAGAPSRPIDVDVLVARLEVVSADREALPQPPSPTSSTTTMYDDEEMYRYHLEKQTDCYNTLVNEGGRPSHPISLGRDIIENPGAYREILSFWNHGTNDWQVFTNQMREWNVFRESQRYNREEGRFPRYVEAVKRGLARHGFTRLFQLDEDLERQDKLTTWIEYLDYEYWKQDKHIKYVKRLQPQYDEAWRELVDSQVLRPFETEEFICSIKSTFQHAREEERAELAVESAKLAVTLAQNDTGTRGAHPSQQETQRLSTAQSELDAAVESLELIKRRNSLVHEFYEKTQLCQITKDGKLKRSYQDAKDDAEHRNKLLRWIVQQIPLIELELAQAQVAESDFDVLDCAKRHKHHLLDDLNAERVSKRRREDGWDDALSSCTTRASKAVTASQDSSAMRRRPQTEGQEGRLKRNCHDAIDEGRSTKRPRCGGKKTSAPTEPISIGEPLPTKSVRSDPDNGVTQKRPKPRKKQPKVYKKERESRRIAGHLPQFGMLPKRGEPAPPYVPPSRYPPNTRKPNSPSLHRHVSSKKNSLIVKGAQHQGISKAKRDSKRLGRTNKPPSGGTYVQV